MSKNVILTFYQRFWWVARYSYWIGSI